MNNTKLKKQLSLAVFLPFLFVSTYSNSVDTSLLPLYFVTTYITENEIEYNYSIKNIKTLKNLINNIISQIKRVFGSFEIANIYSRTIKNIVIGEKKVVLNKGSPILSC